MKTLQPDKQTAGGATENREQILNRLRTSKEGADFEAEQAGLEAGRSWAEKQAEVGELRRLSAFVRTNDGWRLAETGEVEFFRIINPREIPTSRTMAEFWRTMTDGEETPDPLFVEAFVCGAVDFWDEVEDQL
jgi:hypothetical protein